MEFLKSIKPIWRFYRKIPTFVWGAAALFGAFGLGVIFALSVEAMNQPVAYKDLEERHENHLKLVDSYEDLSQMYRYQGDNINVIMDLNMLEENPQEYFEALDSIKEYRDRILIQTGRILELRKASGLLNESSSK